MLLAAASTGWAQPGWQSRDIGTSTAGSTTVSGGAVSLTGSGRDIWNEQDGFRYYYQEVPGEFEMVVRVQSLTPTHGWAKAAIMMRETLDPGSPHKMVCVSSVHGTAFQWRSNLNGASFSTTPSEDGGPPRWLKLSRRQTLYSLGGDILEASVSRDGVNWTLATREPDHRASMLLGLAVTSHADGLLCTAEFDQLALTLPPAAASNLRVTHRGPNGQLNLAWNDNSNDETGFIIEAMRDRLRDFTQIGEVGPNTTTFSATGLAAGWYHDVRVKAVKRTVGVYSPKIQVITTPNVEISAPSQTSTSITVRVTEYTTFMTNSGGPYAIERSTDGTNFVQIASGLRRTGGDGTVAICDYVDQTVTPGTPYYYRARYLDTNGDSGAYATLTSPVTTSGSPPPTTPAAPSNLAATTLSSSQIRLTWTDNATNETDYHIERSNDGVAFGISFSGGGANQTSMTDSGLSPSTTYFYRVRAVNANGASAYSNVTSATTSGGSSSGAPSNLVATALSSTEVRLTWADNSSDETSFVVRRSTDGTNYTDALSVGANVTAATDTGRTAGTRYYYLVGAVRPGTTEPALSNQATVVTPDSAWTSADIGAVGASGRVDAQSNGTIAVTGSGEDIWGTQDAFHFYSTALAGDGEISVRVTALDRTQSWAKAGVMMRASADPGAPYVFIFVNPDFTIAWQHRDVQGGNASFGGVYGWPPAWLKIVRSGNAFAVQYSQDGSTWSLANTFNVSLPSTVRAGLAVTSHLRGTLATGTFDQLLVRGGSAPPPPPSVPAAPTNLTATAASSASVQLGWTDNASNESGFELERSTNGTDFTRIATPGANATQHADPTVAAGVTYHYRIRAINSAGASGYSAIVSITPGGAPTPWTTANIGRFGLAGSFTDGGSTLTVRGSGEDIWDTADGFFFAYKSWPGDVQIVARVQSMTDTHTWAKVGLMVRESTAPGARHAFVFITPGIGTFGHHRTITGGTTAINEGPWWATAPYWLKLVRQGNTFTSYTSPDGVTWSLLSTTNIDLTAEALIGLAVTAHDVTKLNVAEFTNVQVNAP